MDTRGWQGGLSWLSLLLGLVILPLALLPLLQGWGVIGFGLPGFLSTLLVKSLLWLLGVLGLWLIIEGFFEGIHDAVQWTTIIVAALIFLLALVQILNSMGVLGFSLPWIGVTAYLVLLTIEGLLLLVGAFAMD